MTIPVILLLVTCFIIENTNGLNSLDEFTPENVAPIFNLLGEHGENERRIYNEKYDNNWSQFLTVAVLTENEILHPKFEEIKTRIKVFMNDDDMEFFLGRKVHGEVKAIYQDGLQNMYEEFQRKKPNAFPIVVMFSYYIPCANVKRLKYSCSEEVAKLARVNAGNIAVMVAYYITYPGTNEQAAKDFLEKGRVKLFQKNGNNYLSLYNVGLLAEPSIYQTELYDCLMKRRVSTCCTGEMKANITTYFVNYMVYTSVQEMLKETNGFKGSLNINNKETYENIINNFANDNISKDCKKKNGCGTIRDILKKEVYNCAVTPYRVRLGSDGILIGQPADLNESYNPKWIKLTGNIQAVFQYEPRQHSRSFCGPNTLSERSMCTKNLVGNNNRAEKPNKVQKRIIKHERLQQN